MVAFTLWQLLTDPEGVAPDLPGLVRAVQTPASRPTVVKIKKFIQP